jgi:YhcH/YjgK/YiaL family protein
MILDQLSQAERYFNLHPGFAAAFAFLRRSDLGQLLEGRYEIDGDAVYALVQRRPGRSRAEGKLEAHRNYIDIQFVACGQETMGWISTSACQQVKTPYDPAKDIEFFADEPTAWMAVRPGEFGLFFPADAHMPLIGEGEIHKVVVKVRVASS